MKPAAFDVNYATSIGWIIDDASHASTNKPHVVVTTELNRTAQLAVQDFQ